MNSYSDDHPVRRMRALGALLVVHSRFGLKADAAPKDGSVLPFPPVPSASVAAETLQESKHQRRVEPNHLPKDAPNIVIILLDDVGFGLPDTFGGPIHTPTLSSLPTRASATIPFIQRRSALPRGRRC